MVEKPDRTPQLKIAVYQGLGTLSFGLIGALAFWLQGPPSMATMALALAGVGLFTIVGAGLQIVWIRRRKRIAD